MDEQNYFFSQLKQNREKKIKKHNNVCLKPLNSLQNFVLRLNHKSTISKRQRTLQITKTNDRVPTST